MKAFKMGKMLISHYRVGKTDGVSLEIEKRREVLKKMGHDVKLLSGPRQSGADFVIPELEFDSPRIAKINNNSFRKLKDFSELELEKEIETVVKIIKKKTEKLLLNSKVDFLFLHNIFSHGRHIVATKAFYDLVKENRIQTIATHHDFYWEREIYQRPTCSYIEKYLKRYFIPKLPYVKHVVINSQAKKQLTNKFGISSKIIPDTFDFQQLLWQVDWYNHDFKSEVIKAKESDVVFLQATRVVERKGIELAIDLVATLNRPKYRRQLINKTLYNGEIFDGKSDIILVLAGYAEKDSRSYLDHLKRHAKRKKIILRDVSGRIRAERKNVQEKKYYSLWDSYVFADLVTYPSLWEGWGNQFIEAVFAKKPVAVYEYPVWQSDIAPEGYGVISLGKKRQAVSNKLAETDPKLLERAAQQVVDVLTDKKLYQQMVARNYRIGRKNHSFETLHSLLEDLL